MLDVQSETSGTCTKDLSVYQHGKWNQKSFFSKYICTKKKSYSLKRIKETSNTNKKKTVQHKIQIQRILPTNISSPNHFSN